jgi:hypothetical protein
MGYTTDFHGTFRLDKPLKPEHKAYLEKFSETRRMRRHAHLTQSLPDPIREAVGLPVGDDGAYYVGAGGDFGQEHAKDVKDYNYSPAGQPGLWCQWVPTHDGKGLEWNGSEKFYNYVEWLGYLIQNFLAPWGYRLSGEVEWQGEESHDLGKIVVKNNKVSTLEGKITYG